MHKTYYCCLSAAALLLLASCEHLLPSNAYRPPPDSDLSVNFRDECSDKFDFAKNQYADEGKCDALRVCLIENMRDTILSDNSTWPIVDKIKPRIGGFPTLIPEMRANAEKAGPKAVEMFQLIYDIRKQCVIETELDEIMADT